VTRAAVLAESSLAGVAEAVKDTFHQTKKKATVVLATPRSMEGDKIGMLCQLGKFVQRLDRNDQILCVWVQWRSGRVFAGGGVLEEASETRENAQRTLCDRGHAALRQRKPGGGFHHPAPGAGQAEWRTAAVWHRGSLGCTDTASNNSENQMFSCLPSGESVEGVKIFTIAYGEDADKDLMLRVANRTNGKTFTGDPESIEQIYIAISAEQ
jgi:hypothetical protein